MQPVVIKWRGGEHPFRLGIGELRAIQNKTDCGPEFLLHKISAARWHIDDLREIIRNGLIGGGMGHVDALNLVDKISSEAPGIVMKAPAMEIVAAYLYGPEDDQVGEPTPVVLPTPETEKTASGSSAPTTD